MIADIKLMKLTALIRVAHHEWPDGECMINLSINLPDFDRISGSMCFDWKCDIYPDVSDYNIDEIISLIESKIKEGK